jgi:CHAD domain-containing protein
LRIGERSTTVSTHPLSIPRPGQGSSQARRQHPRTFLGRARKRSEPAHGKLFDKARASLTPKAKKAIQSPRYTGTALRLARWFETCGWRNQLVSEQSALLVAPVGTVAPMLVKRRLRQARKRSRRFGELSQQQRHKLRIALKKLRYTIDLLSSLFDRKRVKRLEKLLRPLQDDLGFLKDIRAAHELTSESPGSSISMTPRLPAKRALCSDGTIVS